MNNTEIDKKFICENCGKEFTEDYRKSLRPIKKEEPRFCSRSCACSYSSNTQDQTKRKPIECSICHELKEVNIHCSSKSFICDDCKRKNGFLDSKKRSKIKRILNKKNFEFTEENFQKEYKSFLERNAYKYPGNSILGKFERSQPFKLKLPTLKKLGFNFEKNWEEEFFRIRNILYDIYFREKKSLTYMRNIFGINLNSNTVKKYMRLFGFLKLRNPSEETRTRFLTGDISINSPENSKYKVGWYKYNNNEFYYRSSYELKMIEALLKNNIKFECNSFKIKYYDSSIGVRRVGFPDFYLPDYNLIIETKSDYFYDEKNLDDRYVEIKKMNLEFLVVKYENNIFKILKNYSNNEEYIHSIMFILNS